LKRNTRLTIRLTEAERGAVDALAQAERLPTSTLARRLLLLEADERGLWPDEVQDAANEERLSTEGRIGDDRQRADT
jgi:hypothetical protein